MEPMLIRSTLASACQSRPGRGRPNESLEPPRANRYAYCRRPVIYRKVISFDIEFTPAEPLRPWRLSCPHAEVMRAIRVRNVMSCGIRFPGLSNHFLCQLFWELLSPEIHHMRWSSVPSGAAAGNGWQHTVPIPEVIYPTSANTDSHQVCARTPAPQWSERVLL